MFDQVTMMALRFLWWPEGNLNNPPEEYQMNVQIIGSTSSPNYTSFAQRETASDNAQHFRDQMMEMVKCNFYIDDCLKLVSQEDKAVKLAKELHDLLALRGFKLTKWLSNSREVIEPVPESERAHQVKDLDSTSLQLRVLGVQWNISSDMS